MPDAPSPLPSPSPVLIYAPISAGELLDKISILAIKLRCLHNADQLDHVRDEHAALKMIERNHLGMGEEIGPLVQELAAVNQRLWDIEEDIRAHEARQDFGESFVALARAVYTCNDQRAALKHAINTRTGSRLVEEKSYGGGAGTGTTA